MTERDAFLTIIERYVTHCCSIETPPRVSELAQFVEVSACTLARKARDYRIALAEALKDAQFRRAKRMLRFTDTTTTRIAYACGFGTRRTFFRAFQRAVGMTPAQYREAIRKCPYPKHESRRLAARERLIMAGRGAGIRDLQRDVTRDRQRFTSPCPRAASARPAGFSRS